MNGELKEFNKFWDEHKDVIDKFKEWIKCVNHEKQKFGRAGKQNFAPYKFYAILSICENWKNNDTQIILDDNIFNTYGDYCFNDYYLKQEGWINNKKISSRTPQRHFLDLPMCEKNGRKQNCFFTITEDKKYLNVSINIPDKFFDLFKLKIITLCNNVLFNDEYEWYFNNDWKKSVYRFHQNEWALLIKENNNFKCLVCGIKSIQLLEAAHIKPYAECVNDNERYSQWNGITLCANHHRMFDKMLLLKKEGNDYVFYFKNNIENAAKNELKDILNNFTIAINNLKNKNQSYTPYFDYLANKNSVNY